MTRKIVKLSLQAIVNHKMRSFLTVLGIIIGVMAVVILVSITQSAATGITSSISDMGSQLITASVTSDEVSLSRESVESLAGTGAIETAAPTITSSETARHKGESGSYTVAGVTPAYFDVQGIAVQSGRAIAESDLDSSTWVAVLGTEAAYDLFGTWDAVGGTITLGERNYKVVGVLEEQGSSLSGSDDSRILIPYTTAQRATGQKGVGSFYVKASSAGTVSLDMNTVEAYLLQATRDEDAYSVSNQSQVLDTMDEVDNTMSLLLGGIAAISLLVGGIGIMNIMLVSVTERTREIGIRKAVGAKRRHILLQFLCESCILSLLGGAVGLALSFGVVAFYNLAAGSSASLNWAIGGAAILFCGVIGILFGSSRRRKPPGSSLSRPCTPCKPQKNSEALGRSPGLFAVYNFTRKRILSPSRPRAVMSPPWRWAMPLAMDSPTPKPLP